MLVCAKIGKPDLAMRSSGANAEFAGGAEPSAAPLDITNVTAGPAVHSTAAQPGAKRKSRPAKPVEASVPAVEPLDEPSEPTEYMRNRPR